MKRKFKVIMIASTLLLVGVMTIKVTASEKQPTKTYSPKSGSINTKVFSQEELNILTTISHGTQYEGNTGLDLVSSDFKFLLNGNPIPNIVGTDGVLQLYNESTFMPKEAVLGAINFWNALAGTKIVELVDSIDKADEALGDSIEADNQVLGGQTYDGKGILFYPNSWHIENKSKNAQLNIKTAVVAHEIGHALGVPHFRGGYDGENGARAGIAINEDEGFKSSKVQASILAMAATTWQKPRRIADWVLNNNYEVTVSDGKVITNIPVKNNETDYTEEKNDYGISIDFDDNLIQDMPEPVKDIQVKIEKNFNVYQLNDKDIKAEKVTPAKYISSTKYLNLIGNSYPVSKLYSASSGYYYYEINVGNEKYVINSLVSDDKGRQINSPKEFINNDFKDINKKFKIKENYNVYSLDREKISRNVLSSTIQNGTTKSHGIINKSFEVTDSFTSSNGNVYYVFNLANKNYAVNSMAFEKIIYLDDEYIEDVNGRLFYQDCFINKNQEVYKFTDNIKSPVIAEKVGSTDSLNLTNKTTKVTKIYESNNGNIYYRIGEYVIPKTAFLVNEENFVKGIEMASPNDIITNGTNINVRKTVIANYNLYDFEEKNLNQNLSKATLKSYVNAEKMMNIEVKATKEYKSSKGYIYNRIVLDDGREFVVNASALK